jgi:hypothetical protein
MAVTKRRFFMLRDRATHDEQFSVHGETMSVIETPRPKVPAMSLPGISSISSDVTTTFGQPLLHPLTHVLALMRPARRLG